MTDTRLSVPPAETPAKGVDPRLNGLIDFLVDVLVRELMAEAEGPPNDLASTRPAHENVPDSPDEPAISDPISEGAGTLRRISLAEPD